MTTGYSRDVKSPTISSKPKVMETQRWMPKNSKVYPDNPKNTPSMQ